MPVAAPRPCRHPGCGKLVSDGTGYCAAHQADRRLGKFADQRRGSRHQRGYGSEWEKTRKRILSRDKGLCQPCLHIGRVSVAKQVDHIKPKFEGGSDADSNLQAICVACHQAKTKEEALRARLGVGG